MAENRSSARRLVRRALGAFAAVVLVASLAQVASADPTTKDKLEAAKAEFAQLKRQIQAQNEVLSRLLLEAAEIAQRLDDAQARYEQITEELRTTTLQLRQAQADYQGLQDRLESRAREAYITGPGSSLEFLLGATSLADLSARMEYVNALSEEDADLATDVQNLRNDLSARQADQQKLQEKAARALREVQVQQAALDAKLDEQQTVLDHLNADRARAEELVKDLTKQYQRELAALSNLRFFPNAILQICPVDVPHAVYDGFGAPRYAGGYHPHAGNDIIAPQGTKIFAPFDGYAHTSSNTLGGYAEYVTAPDGSYVYNAHMMAPGVTGQVTAGDVIGYVGATGDTSTPHDHFEWHPSVTPSNWPASPYGYSVIDTGYGQPAVNPWPLLQQVC